MRSGSVWAMLLLAWAFASAGCFLALSFDDFDTSDPVVAPEAGADGSSPEASAGSALMTIAPAEVTLFNDTEGKRSANVDVKLERRDGFSGVVRMSATGLPPGVTSNASTVVITATATAAVVTFSAAADAKHAKATVTLRGEADGKTFDATVALLVRGGPGSVDTSFGDGGLSHVAVGDDAQLTQMQILADDRIVLAGGVGGKDPSFAVARLLAEGAVDPAFGGKGFVTGAAKGARATGLGVVPGGLVAAGDASGKIAVVRYRDDGSVDPALNGEKAISIGASPFLVVGVFAKPGGGVALAGHDGFRSGVVHLDGDGGVDTKVGDGGIVSADENRAAGGAALTADGTILIGGSSPFGGCAIHPFGAFGATSTGTPEEVGTCDAVRDLALGDGGTRGATGTNVRSGGGNVFIGYRRMPSDGPKSSIQVGDGQGDGVAVDSASRILVVGKPAGNDGRTFFVKRVGVDDKVDPTFQVASTPIGISMEGQRVGVQRDGRVVVAGTSESLGKTKSFTVVRYWP